MRLAISISPSRVRSSTEPISRMYMRTGSVVRPNSESMVSGEGLLGLLDHVLLGDGGGGRLGQEERLGIGRLVVHGDAHVGEHRDHALDLLGVGHVVGQVVVDLGVREVAALLAQDDQVLQALLLRLDLGELQLRPSALCWRSSRFADDLRDGFTGGSNGASCGKTANFITRLGGFSTAGPDAPWPALCRAWRPGQLGALGVGQEPGGPAGLQLGLAALRALQGEPVLESGEFRGEVEVGLLHLVEDPAPPEGGLERRRAVLGPLEVGASPGRG